MDRTRAAIVVLVTSAALLPTTTASATPPTASATFGGYEVDSSTLTQITADLTVPKVHCTKAGQAFQSGIVFNGQTTLGGIFTSSSYSAATVWTTCQAKGHKKVALDKVVLFVNNTQESKTLKVAAGQKLTLSVALLSKASKVKVVATDLKTKKKLSKSGPVSDFAALNVQAGNLPLDNSSTGNPLPVPRFGNDNFTKVMLGTAKLGASSPVAFALARGKTVLTKPSAIRPAASFHMIFVHS